MRSFLTALFFLAAFPLLAQPAYDLQFKVDGWKDTTAYLGHFYGESTYIKDTAKVNSNGEFRFQGPKPLGQGVYFLVLNKSKMFEFVVGNTQKFKMETSTADFIGKMKVTGDNDNRLFFENWNYNITRQKEADPYIKVLRDSTLKDDQKKDARAGFASINDKVVTYQTDLIAKNPETITALILKSSLPVKIPDPPKKADGSIDSTFQLRWYRDHFFDNFDLSNEALLRMPRPVYSEKINEYLDKLYAPQADSLTKAADKIIQKAKKTQETYKYATWTVMQKFQQPEIMGLDAVYVNIYDKYVSTGQMDFWISAQFKKNLQEFADRLRKSLIGKTGPNLIMQDATLKPKALYDMKSRYTILYIFDPDCGHCKEETPKLVDFFNRNKTKFNVDVYAVSADTSISKMKDYIRDMKIPFTVVNGPRTYVGPYQDHYDAVTTPSLFILDNKRKIIAKKIPAEKLEDFFIQYQKFNKPETSATKPKTP